jgi:predicted HicB family RNase H-like nuclease
MQYKSSLPRKFSCITVLHMAKPRGRPPIDPAKKASEMVPVRMTQAERSVFEQAASKSDKTLSAWIRDCLTKAAKKASKR